MPLPKQYPQQRRPMSMRHYGRARKLQIAFARDWMGDVPNEVKEFRSELDSGVEAVLTVRYIDEAG